MIHIGDFVTSCTAGYWELISIKPKIAESDFRGEKVRWKKGDTIGQWFILKKAFTPKMKPRIEYEYVDSKLIRPVSEEVRTAIVQYFADNPKYKAKYDASEVKLTPVLTNCYLSMPQEREADFCALLEELPARFTSDEFWKLFKSYKQYVSKPPATYLLNFESYPWDLDRKCNVVYTGCKLTKL